jgi:type VI secretion system protein ImpJ
MNARKIPEAIQWQEGMLLTPEHFQQLTARLEMLLEYASASAPFAWGIRRLAYDANLLTSGTFRLLDLEAIMPDGLLTTLPDEGLQKNFGAQIEEFRRAPQVIHLAVPARRAAAARGDLDRYAPLNVEANPDDDEDPIPRVAPQFTLLTGEVPAKYTSLPLARIRYENEAFVIDPDYNPPELGVDSNSSLWGLCSAVASRVREKALYLSDRVHGPAMKAGSTNAIETKAMIQSLVGGLPFFEALLYSGRAHPFDLYRALCAMAGDIAGIGYGLVPPVFKPYDHNDARTSFAQVRDFIFQSISEGIAEAWLVFRMDQEDDRFSLGVKAGWAEQLAWDKQPSSRRLVVLGIRGAPGMSEADVREWGKSCLIGNRGAIPSLISNRVLGAPRKAIERLDDLTPPRAVQLFTVELDHAIVRLGEDLNVLDSRPGAVRPADVFLYVRKSL